MGSIFEGTADEPTMGSGRTSGLEFGINTYKKKGEICTERVSKRKIKKVSINVKVRKTT
jgi:hypothetical protein